MADLEKYEVFFNEHCVEDIEEVITICEAASITIKDRFKTRFDDPRLLAVTFNIIFDTFIQKLLSLKGEYSDFTFDICDRLEIGYTNKEDEDDEKSGNYNIFVRHLNNTKKNNEVEDPTAKAVERAVQWNTENIIEQPELMRSIAVEAVKNLKEISLNLAASELVMPIFITVYESIVNYIKIKRREVDAFEKEINFVSCFNIGARETEDGEDDIYIRPMVETKVDKVKNDADVTAKNE